MPIKNYTTKIAPSKTVSEIQTMLMKAGADQVLIEYEAGGPMAISFLILVRDDIVPFRMEPHPAAVLKTLKMDKAGKQYETLGQAERVAWRLLRDWLDVQLAFVHAGQAELSQLLLGYAVHRSGDTYYDRLIHSDEGRALLADHL